MSYEEFIATLNMLGLFAVPPMGEAHKGSARTVFILRGPDEGQRPTLLARVAMSRDAGRKNTWQEVLDEVLAIDEFYCGQERAESLMGQAAALRKIRPL
jgi:hypothetical protein